jgi:hypothetical protein
LSEAAPSVRKMDADDLVDSGDAALQASLASVAENASDDERRDRLMDGVVTVPPLREWPADSLDELGNTMQFVISCAQDLRRRRRAGEL